MEGKTTGLGMKETTFVQTRDGRPARILCTNAKDSGGQNGIIALVTDSSGAEYLIDTSPMVCSSGSDDAA